MALWWPGARRRRAAATAPRMAATFHSLLILSFLGPALAFVEKDDCGLFDPEPQQELARLQVDDRIVNGYKVLKHRPWMVRVGKITDSGKIHTFCGGSIINNWYVLTAAHCFCDSYSQGNPDEVDCAVESIGRSKVLTGEEAGKYVMFMGSLTVNPTKENAKTTDKITVHPKMRLVEPWSFDIALMRTTEKIHYSTNVAPICLPSESTPELFESVFVAGWGALRAKPINTDACSTTQFGPSKFKPCEGAKRGKKFQCSREPAPNAASCSDLLDHSEIDAQVDVARVDGTNCYLPKHNTHGWCYTVDKKNKEKDKEKGKEKEKPEDKGEAAPSATKPWGFCFKACEHKVRQGSNENLREVSLDVLDTEKCNKKKKTIDSDRELCIARALKKPIVGVYVKDDEEGGYVLKDINSKGFYNFIGYQDACQGDSGGPYYLYQKDSRGRRRATIIGLVSRGNGCADKNEPGKATRIKYFATWINEVTAGGGVESAATDDADEGATPSGSNRLKSAGDGVASNVEMPHQYGGSPLLELNKMQKAVTQEPPDTQEPKLRPYEPRPQHQPQPPPEPPRPAPGILIRDKLPGAVDSAGKVHSSGPGDIYDPILQQLHGVIPSSLAPPLLAHQPILYDHPDPLVILGSAAGANRHLPPHPFVGSSFHRRPAVFSPILGAGGGGGGVVQQHAINRQLGGVPANALRINSASIDLRALDRQPIFIPFFGRKGGKEDEEDEDGDETVDAEASSGLGNRRAKEGRGSAKAPQSNGEKYRLKDNNKSSSEEEKEKEEEQEGRKELASNMDASLFVEV